MSCFSKIMSSPSFQTSSNTTFAETISMPISHNVIILSFRCMRSSCANVALVEAPGNCFNHKGTTFFTISKDPVPSGLTL